MQIIATPARYNTVYYRNTNLGHFESSISNVAVAQNGAKSVVSTRICYSTSPPEKSTNSSH